MPTITLYSKPNCPLCDHTRHYLHELQAEAVGAGWTVDEVNILDDPALYRQYRYAIPVVAVEGGVTLVAPLSLQPPLLRRAVTIGRDPQLAITAQAGLVAAAEERARLEAEEAGQAPVAATDAGPQAAGPSVAPPGYAPPAAPGSGSPLLYEAAPLPAPLRLINTFANGMVRNFLGVLTAILGVWVLLPWLAPVFAKLGWWGPANGIYTVYIFFCHQLPERAAILFGYQVAWCWRNTALYTSIFVVGLLCLTLGQAGRGPGILRRGISWQVLVLCSIPIALDGFSHMLGLRVDNAWFDALTGGAFHAFTVGDQMGTLNWWLRILTGGLFGAAVALFGYPLLARTLREESRYWQGGPSLPPAAAAG
jgi:uncharacterized membrane protein